MKEQEVILKAASSGIRADAEPLAELTRVLTFYREQYRGFNGRHFHQIARREHAVTLSYSFPGSASASCSSWWPRQAWCGASDGGQLKRAEGIHGRAP
jgi:hypothetical protein